MKCILFQNKGTELLKRINHKNIIKLLDYKENIYVFELMDTSLKSFIRTFANGIESSTVLVIVQQILEALQVLKVIKFIYN